MAYQMAQIRMTLSEVEGHFLVIADKVRWASICICRASCDFFHVAHLLMVTWLLPALKTGLQLCYCACCYLWLSACVGLSLVLEHFSPLILLGGHQRRPSGKTSASVLGSFSGETLGILLHFLFF